MSEPRPPGSDSRSATVPSALTVRDGLNVGLVERSVPDLAASRYRAAGFGEAVRPYSRNQVHQQRHAGSRDKGFRTLLDPSERRPYPVRLPAPVHSSLGSVLNYAPPLFGPHSGSPYQLQRPPRPQPRLPAERRMNAIHRHSDAGSKSTDFRVGDKYERSPDYGQRSTNAR